MRPIVLVSLLLASFALAGCGDSGNSFEFRTISAEPSGKHIKIAYAMKPGDGVRMTMQMNGRMKMTGTMDVDMPIDMSFTTTMRCTEVKSNGDKVLAMTIDATALNVGEELSGAMENMDISGTLTLDKTGKVTSMDFDASDPQINAKIGQALKNPGFQYFVPMPPEGMRVGEALDLAKVMPAKAFEELMNSAAGGSTSVKPDLRGEIVLLGTKNIDGEDAAEFGVNMVMNIKLESEAMKMDMGMRVKGKQFCSLRTGLPAGTATSTMEMRLDGAAAGMEYESDSKMTLTITCEPLGR